MKFHNTLERFFQEDMEVDLNHRYITNNHIEILLKKLPNEFETSTVGFSVNRLPIYSVKVGYGKLKILIWSQMHGNESTTTKALFDLFNSLASNRINSILKKCTLYVIPILNPDGADVYKRENANGIDLNRDAQELSQPESQVLRELFDSIQPNYCFNLHGQRTIFSTGETNKPATLSFLSPAQDENCSITKNRKIAMTIIVKMINLLHNVIPNQIGIYNDAFNLNCVGDTFQSLGVPTILFEAGHYKNDYPREKVRKLMYMALLTALRFIATKDIKGEEYNDYSNIPMNKKLFFDIIIRNALLEKNGNPVDIAIQYDEILNNKKIHFIPTIRSIGNLDKFFGHKEINVKSAMVVGENKQKLNNGYSNDCVWINDELFSLKL